MNKLKEKWGISSNRHLALIFLIFSITGSLSVVVKAKLFTLIGITSDTSWFIVVPLYIIAIIPIYYIILIIVGSLFGQFRFFFEFGKKSLGRLFLRRKPA